MRFPVLFVAIIASAAACGGGSAEGSRATTMAAAGPDPVVIRIPRSGGLVRAYRFAALDSAIWRSSHSASAVERILAFDQDNGLLAFADTTGYPGWIDLRLGSVRRPSRGTFASLASADGWAIYGLSNGGGLVRMTPSGDWQAPLPYPVKRLLPTPDGGLLLIAEVAAGDGRLLRMRPPDETITDSLDMIPAERAAVTSVGDRAYLSAGDRLWSVAPNALAGFERFETSDEVLALAPSPSGDRVFLANQGSTRLEMLDRYEGNIRKSVKLPGLATELRMDPLGRFLLVRPVEGDSVWVIDVGTEAFLGSFPTRWRPDLPAVAFDGTVATWRGDDVAFLKPGDTQETRLVAGGAKDIWFFTRWNGFRPRARGIDQPVAFRSEGGPIRPVDEPPPAAARTTPVPEAPPRAAEPPPPAAAPPAGPTEAPRARGAWILSFAAVLSMERAQEIARQINVNGGRPRVIAGSADGTSVFRVISGPYPSREEAERNGRASGHSFWVYEGGS